MAKGVACLVKSGAGGGSVKVAGHAHAIDSDAEALGRRVPQSRVWEQPASTARAAAQDCRCRVLDIHLCNRLAIIG